MGKIKNLVFDFGGVFCSLDLQHCMDAFRQLGFKNVDEYMNIVSQKGFFGDLESGKITDEEFRIGVSRQAGREVSWSECQQAWKAFVVEVQVPNIKQLLRFRAEGYNLALLSNTNPFMASWFRSEELDGEGHGIGHYIAKEHQYLSHEMKCMKPGKEIFQKMLACERFNPAETLFVDDGEVNLKTASELGMHTFQPFNGEEWGGRLESLLSVLARQD